MFSRLTSHLRQNGVAYVALFFALSGGAIAANNYIRSSDTIPEGDLAGSTYGNPLIGSGKVTNGKLANSSLSVNSGTGLTGGGSVSLGGSTTLGVGEGGIGTTQLHDGAVTTSKFDTGAQAPDSAKLGGKEPGAYAAVKLPPENLAGGDLSTPVTVGPWEIRFFCQSGASGGSGGFYVKGPGAAEGSYVTSTDDGSPTLTTFGVGLSTLAMANIGEVVANSGHYGRLLESVLLRNGSTVATLQANGVTDDRTGTVSCGEFGVVTPTL